MNKWMTSALVAALTAGVSMGVPIGWNGAGDGVTWTNAANWVGGALPGAADNAFQNSIVGSATVVLSSTVSIGNLGIGNGGTAPANENMHLIMTNASMTSTGSVEIARNKIGGQLTMYNSTVTGASFLLGRPNGGIEMSGTLVMNAGSTMTLSANFVSFDNQFETTADRDAANLAGTVFGPVGASVTLNGGSWISTGALSAFDNGVININSGSYMQVRNTTSDSYLIWQVDSGMYVVDGVTLTAANKDNYIYKTATDTYVIPEPATALLFGIGGMGAWMLRRNKTRAQEEETDADA